MDTPWCDCKIAFPIDEASPVWAARDAGLLDLPQGWELCETDDSGARCVAVFRVKTLPALRDGAKVRQALDGILSIKQIIEQVRELAASASEPKTMYWLYHDEYGDSDAEYCYECAKKVRAALIAGTPIGDDDRSTEHPNWKDCDPDSIRIDGGDDGFESEGPRHCELCGCSLSVTLLEFGVKSELDHFEYYDIETPGQWRCFLDVLEAIDYVEAPWFPGNHRTAGEIEEARSLYARAITLAKRCLPQPKPVVQNLHEGKEPANETF